MTLRVDTKIFESIASVIPPGRALVLFAFCRGANLFRIYVPAAYHPDSLLAKLLGEEATRALIDQFACETVELSSLASLNAVRHLGEVWAATRRDPAVRNLTLADDLALTDRRIRQLRQQLNREAWPGLEELLPPEEREASA